MKIDGDTKNRLRRLQNEFKNEPKIKVFDNTEKYDQMIIQGGINFITNCEHHHIAFYGKAHVGYIAGGKIIGLSKMPRIVEFYLNPTTYTVQEKATQQIFKYLESKLDNPMGVMVVIEAVHGCLAFRGIKKPSVTTTSQVSGSFSENLETRNEFFEHIRLHRFQGLF